MSLPTISLQSAHLAQEVYEACTSSGFFFLQDHGIDAEKLGAWRASQLLFLDESEDVKRQQTASIDREAHTGYTSMMQEKLDSNSAITMGDLKESFYISPNALSAKRQTLPEVMKPSQDGLEKLDAECMRVCLVLLEAFAKALKLDQNYFASKHNADDDRLRLIHYPPAPVQKGDKEANSIRAGSHSDWGSLTLLFQKDVSGLQVQTGPDAWADVPPKPGCLVVNVGDAMEFWSAGLFRSTQHRVVMPRTEAESVSRLSIAYFCHPDSEALLKPIQNAAGSADAPDDWKAILQRKGIHALEPMTSGEHLKARLRSAGL